MEDKNIFDKLFSLRFMSIFAPVYKKYEGIFLYLIFGALTTVISVLSFVFFDNILGFNVLLANIFSWIFAVTFAYITNKRWVFASKAYGKESVKEAVLFVLARLTTLVTEEIILFVSVVLLDCNNVMMKIFAQFMVLVLNYIISKTVVFNKGEEN